MADARWRIRQRYPQLVKKGQTRLEDFDDKILALYARGMTTRDIQDQLQERSGFPDEQQLVTHCGSK